jgi:hypothetical protein
LKSDEDANSFERDTEWRKLTALFPENGSAHKIMLGHPLGTTCLIEDYRNKDIPTHATSFVKFRQRTYGVLVKRKLFFSDLLASIGYFWISFDLSSMYLRSYT